MYQQQKIENVLFIIIIWFFSKKLDIFDINENDKSCTNILLREVSKISLLVLWIMSLACCFPRLDAMIRISSEWVEIMRMRIKIFALWIFYTHLKYIP